MNSLLETKQIVPFNECWLCIWFDDYAKSSDSKLEFSFFFFLTDYFVDYKRLRGGVYFIDSLPLTPSGKVMRRKVKEIAIEMHENESGEAES